MASKNARTKNRTQKTFYNTRDPGYLIYEKNIPYAKYLVSRLLTGFPRKSKKTIQVLEIGAGQGRFTLELAKRAPHLTATDLSKKQIKKLRVKSTNIQCLVHDLLKKPPKELNNKQFDVICGFFLLHHIERSDYDIVMSHLLLLLKPKGRLVFVEPNSLYPGHLVEMMIMPDMHFHVEKQIYTRYISMFIQVCQSHAMVVRKREVFGFIPPPVINKVPESTIIDTMVEKIPILKHLLCPFILLSVEKSA